MFQFTKYFTIINIQFFEKGTYVFQIIFIYT